MDSNHKIEEYFKRDENLTLSFCCRICAILMIIVLILALTGVFKLGKHIYPAMLITIPIMLLPTFIHNILKINNVIWRYISLTLVVFMSGFLYAVLSYHVVLMLAFPIVLSILYCDKRSVLYVFIVSIPVIIASHFIAYNLKFVPDEPLVTIKGVMLYGILPRIIEYIVFFLISMKITNKINNLINQLIKKNKELYHEQEMIINSLCEMEEARTYETGIHVKRVKEYTKVLCKGLNMSDDDVWKISNAAMLHDIGKILVPRSILEKPSRLTDEEFEEIKLHTNYGMKLLKNTKGDLMQLASQISYEHHERYDGKGYPLGLAGDKINIASRCVAVADVFDALVSVRAYKNAWDINDARNEIIKGRGTQFDPKIVDVFIRDFDKIEEIFKNNPDSLQNIKKEN